MEVADEVWDLVDFRSPDLDDNSPRRLDQTP
jgi:hypothetical protein